MNLREFALFGPIFLFSKSLSAYQIRIKNFLFFWVFCRYPPARICAFFDKNRGKLLLRQDLQTQKSQK
jgi:hypothetical protein